MRMLAQQLWHEDYGFVISAELVFIASVLVIGMVVGLTSFRDAIVSEFSDIAGAVQDFNQCYTFNATIGHSGETHGSAFVDATDHCDEPEDVAGGFDNCIVVFAPEDEDEGGGDGEDETEKISVTVDAEGGDVDASTGGSYGDGWNLWSNGTLSFKVDIPDDGNYEFTANLWGQQGGADLPNAAFLVNGVAIQDFDVTPTSHATAQIYGVNIFLPAGCHFFAIQYTNDYYVPPIDRNLLIDWMNVEGPT